MKVFGNIVAGIFFLIIFAIVIIITSHSPITRDTKGTDIAYGILFMIVSLPFMLVYFGVASIYLILLLKFKRKKAIELAEKLEKKDSIWNNRNMIARAEEVFLKVQNARMERNMDLAKDCMSEKLYAKYKIETDFMISRGLKNILKDIEIKSVTIFSVGDYKDNNKDNFSARIKGVMLNYEVNESTNVVSKGYKEFKSDFEEIWTFIKQDISWMADEVDNDVSIEDIQKGLAFSEG